MTLSEIPELNKQDVVGHYSCGQSGSYTICTAKRAYIEY